MIFSRLPGLDTHWVGCPKNEQQGHESHTRDNFHPRLRYKGAVIDYKKGPVFELTCAREDDEGGSRTVKCIY